MTAKELISKLLELPQDARVYHLWDGHARTEINLVWVSRNGNIITSDFSQTCYSDDTRPLNAPTEKEDKYWATESDPNHDQDDES